MNKHLIVGIVVLLLAAGMSGCVSSIQDIILDDSYYQSAPRDPYTFNAILLIKDILRINVSYGGGCEEHDFALIASSFMESEPVQVNVLLSHDANNDPCDMWITEELVFNLKPLKRAWQQSYHKISGLIVMNLQGYSESIIYEF